MKRAGRKKLGNLAGLIMLLVLLPLLVVWVVVSGAAFAIGGIILRRRFVGKWRSEGRRVLVVYSDSPNWRDYIETNWLPRLQECAVVLNWSRRAEWRRRPPLEARVLRHWGGDREFNPLAVCFPPWRLARVIRFWQPFKDLKHGRATSLHKAEGQLFALVEKLTSPAG